MSYNLPNPSLVGIVLAVSTHNGPQIAFSYPESISTRRLPSRTSDEDVRSEDEYFDDDDYEIEDIEDFFGMDRGFLDSGHKWDASHPNYYLDTRFDLMSFLDARETRGTKRKSSLEANSLKEGLRENLESGSRDNPLKKATKKSTQILGFEPEQLSEMLCPPRAMCNRRFDVMIENVVFLGLPVHVEADGSWRGKKRGRAETNTATNKSTTCKDEPLETAATGEIYPAVDEEVPSQSSGTPMSMFHLVFVMNPPDIERNYRVDEMFYNVTSKLSLSLRYEQQKHDYVWKQVRLILKLKEELRTNPQTPNKSVSDHLLSNSPLCKVMAECFTAISRSQIAKLNINGKLRPFQIPLKTEFHSLPDPTVPYIPGACLLSTINCLGSSGLVNVGETSRYSNSNLIEHLLGMVGPNVDPAGKYNAADNDNDIDEGVSSNPENVVHLALLLWDEPDVIIRDIKAAPDSAIARFVRMIKPTQSLLRIANLMRQSTRTEAQSTTHLSIVEIKTFALHLVYWRRARVIAPLSTRAIYIVSPMAPIATNFHQDIMQFSRQFPTVPSLPLFLRLLSTRSRKPRQFASIIPSRNHKDMYLLALEWLVRFGYVTQLHTYIWLKISKKVKMKIEEELEEELGRAPKKSLGNATAKASGTIKTHLAVDNSSKQTESGENSGDSGNMQVLASVDPNAEIDKLQKKFEASSYMPDLVLEDDVDTILVDPGRASSLERRWITKIIHDECGLSPELTSVFYKLLKYMNGKNSLELLLLRENVSRNDLRKLLLQIDDYIISVRHW